MANQQRGRTPNSRQRVPWGRLRRLVDRKAVAELRDSVGSLGEREYRDLAVRLRRCDDPDVDRIAMAAVQAFRRGGRGRDVVDEALAAESGADEPRQLGKRRSTDASAQSESVSEPAESEPLSGQADPAEVEHVGVKPEALGEDEVEVPVGTVPHILQWVDAAASSDDRSHRARRAREAEMSRDRPRATLIGQVDRIIEEE